MMGFRKPDGKERPSFIEIIGPAGVGKTTLERTLCRARPDMSTLSIPPKFRDAGTVPFLLCNVAALLPIFLSQRPGDRGLTKRETRFMLHLNGWHEIVRRQPVTGSRWLLYPSDYGPLYMLASLIAFGPEMVQRRQFQTWWHGTISHWNSFLNVVIWLDAPNSVLATRLNTRDSWHVVKGEPDPVIHAFLNRYRTGFEEVISLLQTPGQEPCVLRFQTDRQSADEIAEAVLGALYRPLNM